MNSPKPTIIGRGKEIFQINQVKIPTNLDQEISIIKSEKKQVIIAIIRVVNNPNLK